VYEEVPVLRHDPLVECGSPDGVERAGDVGENERLHPFRIPYRILHRDVGLVNVPVEQEALKLEVVYHSFQVRLEIGHGEVIREPS
jgi:hypothetical protein